MREQGGSADGNTGKPEQPTLPHHDRDYRQAVFDEAQTDIAARQRERFTKKETHPTSESKEGLSKSAKRLIAGAIVAALALTASGAALYLTNSPPFRSNEISSSFDIGKLDTKRQAVVLGKNAQEPTSEEMKNLIYSSISEPTSVDNVPTKSIIPSINMQEAGRVETWRTLTAFVGTPGNLHFSIGNVDTHLGLFSTEATNTTTVELFQMSEGLFVQKFDLKNGKYELLTINSGNLALNENIEGVKFIDLKKLPQGKNWGQEVVTTNSRKLDIAENQEIFVTKKPNTEIAVSLSYVNGPKGFSEPILPSVKNNNILISWPKSN